MKDFFDTWKFRILIAVAVFLAGLMLYAAANGRLTAAPQELLSVAVAPFQKVAAVISGGVASVWDKYTSIDETMAENEALREENAQLRRQLADYDQLKAENEAYKNLAGIQEDNPEMSFVSAFVIGRDALDAFGGFTLDKGTVNGVERGDTVIDDQGRLLGTRHRGGPDQLPCADHPAPQLQRGRGGIPHAGQRHPDRGRRLRGRGAVRLYRPVPGVDGVGGG